MHTRARGELRVGRRLVRVRARVRARGLGLELRLGLGLGELGIDRCLCAGVEPSEAVDQLVAAEARFALHSSKQVPQCWVRGTVSRDCVALVVYVSTHYNFNSRS